MQFIKTFISLLVVFFMPFVVDARTYLVSVGISDYPGTKMDLYLPANDASTIKYIYSKNLVTECVLLTNANATKKRICMKLQATFSKASYDDTVVFFFSGHGKPGSFCAYDSQLSYSEIRQIMAHCKARNKIIFADACFSGKMRHGQATKHEQEFNDYNVLLFLSSRNNETSIERADMKNGFFTSCLQNGLRGRADVNRDRIITAKELFDYVSKGVKRLSGDKQHPVMWGRFSDEMVIMKW